MRTIFSGLFLSLMVFGLSAQQNDAKQKLMAAIASGKLAEVKEALPAAAAELNKPTADGSLPLLYAAERNFSEAIVLLVQKGADVNAADAEGRTALMLCGLDMYHIRSSGGGRSAPGLKEEMRKDKKALEKRQAAVRKIIELFIKSGADVNRADNEGSTALHYAVRRDDLPVVKQLLAAGVKAGTRNKQGQSALGILNQGLGKPSKDTAEIRIVLQKAGAPE